MSRGRLRKQKIGSDVKKNDLTHINSFTEISAFDSEDETAACEIRCRRNRLCDGGSIVGPSNRVGHLAAERHANLFAHILACWHRALDLEVRQRDQPAKTV